MKSRIKKIIENIEELNKRLVKEYSKASKKYGFFIQQKKIIFYKNIRKKNKQFRVSAWRYVIPRNFKHLISMPFIYVMIIPVLILDFFVTLYSWTALPLYGIPKVKRKDYIVFDRRFLDYLNIVQKLNCLYCSYVNGFIAYAMEVSARTERYWCPIKAAKKPMFHHTWYKSFADYGNPKEWNEKFNDSKAFNKK